MIVYLVACVYIISIISPQTWSLVALIYNNWIFYLPTAAEKEEGFLLDPVMCTTTRHVGRSFGSVYTLSFGCVYNLQE